MEVLQQLLDLFLHLNTHLNDAAGSLGVWLYLLLFVIVFCETGLVVTPFLPGDSLLFAVGALAADPQSPLSLPLLIVLLIVAAVTGDALNYYLGYRIGPSIFRSEKSRFLNKKHLLRAHEFYERYGGKTIVLARFIPIIRTFAPFVAGIGKMNYRHFSLYNISGGVAWVALFLLGGYFFGRQEWVQQGFHYVIAGIIVISILPAVVELILARYRRKQPKDRPEEVPA